MTRRFAFALLAAILLLLVAAQGASAATSAQIHRDAADGYIDGNYTIAELRAADSTAPAELREYFGWEDAYQEALRRKANPDTPPVAVPVDQDGNGRIDPAEEAAAEAKTKELREKQQVTKQQQADTPEVEPCDDEAAEDDEDCVPDDEATVSASEDDDDDSGSPLIWLIVGLPVLIVAVGAWRMSRNRKGSTDGSDAA